MTEPNQTLNPGLPSPKSMVLSTNQLLLGKFNSCLHIDDALERALAREARHLVQDPPATWPHTATATSITSHDKVGLRNLWSDIQIMKKLENEKIEETVAEASFFLSN